MDKQEYLQRNAPKFTEIISPASQRVERRETAEYSEVTAISVAIVAMIGIWFLVKKSKLATKSDRPNILNRFASPSCKKCRFFSHNSHLKCAVHPVRVGKIEARDCPDYWRHDSRRFWHR